MRLGRKSRPLLLLFGVREGNAYVDIDDRLLARFGFFRLATSVSNIVGWQIEGPWLWIKAIGVRRDLRYGDISFAGVHTAGIRLDFRERVRWGPFRPPALYVTVDDLEGFAEELTRRCITGQDVRRRAQ